MWTGHSCSCPDERALRVWHVHSHSVAQSRVDAEVLSTSRPSRQSVRCPMDNPGEPRPWVPGSVQIASMCSFGATLQIWRPETSPRSRSVLQVAHPPSRRRVASPARSRFYEGRPTNADALSSQPHLAHDAREDRAGRAVPQPSTVRRDVTEFEGEWPYMCGPGTSCADVRALKLTRPLAQCENSHALTRRRCR